MTLAMATYSTSPTKGAQKIKEFYRSLVLFSNVVLRHFNSNFYPSGNKTFDNLYSVLRPNTFQASECAWVIRGITWVAIPKIWKP